MNWLVDNKNIIIFITTFALLACTRFAKEATIKNATFYIGTIVALLTMLWAFEDDKSSDKSKWKADSTGRANDRLHAIIRGKADTIRMLETQHYTSLKTKSETLLNRLGEVTDSLELISKGQLNTLNELSGSKEPPKFLLRFFPLPEKNQFTLILFNEDKNTIRTVHLINALYYGNSIAVHNSGNFSTFNIQDSDRMKRIVIHDLAPHSSEEGFKDYFSNKLPSVNYMIVVGSPFFNYRINIALKKSGKYYEVVKSQLLSMKGGVATSLPLENRLKIDNICGKNSSLDEWNNEK